MKSDLQFRSAHSGSAQRPLVQFAQSSSLDLRQKHLSKFCHWEEFDQVLWVDARKLFPEVGVLSLPSWDKMMLDGEPIPEYPVFIKPFEWPKNRETDPWLKQIPKWVQDSCRLFPSHQLTLLHYAAKYPQLFELLDQSPMLAWRLVTSGLSEPDVVALMTGNRQQMVQQLGWPGKAETVKLLRNLRLRFVNQQIAEQIEACIIDPKRLHGLQALPRINSMALSLAAGFPQLIGSLLHKSLAQLPCRPMQCQAMVALLEDALLLLALLGEEDRIVQLAECRFLTDVERLYQQWLAEALPESGQALVDSGFIDEQPKVIQREEELVFISRVLQHPWWLLAKAMPQQHSIVVWRESSDDGGARLWAAEIEWPDVAQPETQAQVLKIRGEDNCLAQARQLSDLHLWLLQQLPKNAE